MLYSLKNNKNRRSYVVWVFSTQKITLKINYNFQIVMLKSWFGDYYFFLLMKQVKKYAASRQLFDFQYRTTMYFFFTRMLKKQKICVIQFFFIVRKKIHSFKKKTNLSPLRMRLKNDCNQFNFIMNRPPSHHSLAYFVKT